MKVSEAITASGITPASGYTGIETADDFVLAIKTGSSQAAPKDYIVCQDRIREHSGALNVSSNEATYIRAGAVTTKSATARTLTVEGDRMVGDAFQDFVLSHDIKYGTGSDVVVPYVYFSLRTGEGEQGEATIIVNTDVGGAAGTPATFSAELRSMGVPTAYTYSAS